MSQKRLHKSSCKKIMKSLLQEQRKPSLFSLQISPISRVLRKLFPSKPSTPCLPIILKHSLALSESAEERSINSSEIASCLFGAPSKNIPMRQKEPARQLFFVKNYS